MSSVLLSPVGYEDLELLRDHRNERDTRQWLENNDTIDPEEQVLWWEKLKSPSNRFFYLARHVDGRKIGLSRITINVDSHSMAEVGCDVFSEFRRQGLGHEIFAETCLKAKELGAQNLSLWVFLTNSRALKIYQKANFKFDQSTPIKLFMRNHLLDGMLKPTPYVRMTRTY